MAVPIWKDKIVNIGLLDVMYYRIILSDTNEVIYSGKSYMRPGADFNQVKINDICADYLENVLPNLSQAEFSLLTLPVTFIVQSSSDGSTWANIESVQFLRWKAFGPHCSRMLPKAFFF